MKYFKYGLGIIVFISVIYGLGGALLPLLAAFVISYLLFPLVKSCENVGLSRNLAISCVFLVLFLILGLLLLILLPKFVHQVQGLIKSLPSYISILLKKVEYFLTPINLEISDKKVIELVQNQLQNISLENVLTVKYIFNKMFSNILKFVLITMQFFLFPIFFVYILNDYENIRSKVYNMIPDNYQHTADIILENVNQILSGYIRGQLLVAGCLALFYSIGLSIVGLQFGFLIGIITGLLSFIPYVGIFIGLLLSSMVLLTSGTVKIALGVASVFAVIQILESIVITPKLVGDKLGLNSLTVMLALIVGANFLGVIGMLIAIPVTCIAIRLTQLEFSNAN